MPVKSLVELATTVIMKNIRQLTTVGEDMPYENVREILLRVDDAKQLREIERNSPQLQGQTAECWLRLIEKEFPLEYKATAYKPSDPTKWHRVWEKYKREHDKALYESEMKLKNALMGLKQDKEENKSRIVENKLLPRKPPKSRASSSSRLAFSAGSRTSTATSAGILRKVKREAREYANMRALSKPVVSRPLSNQIEAPRSMLEARRREALPDGMPKAPVPEPKPAKKMLSVEELERSSAVDEHNRKAMIISDSESDDEDHDPIFDEPTPRSKPAARPLAKPTKPTTSASLLKSRPRPSAQEARPSASAAKPSYDKARAPKPEEPAKQSPPRPLKATSSATTKRPASSGLMSKFGAKAIKKTHTTQPKPATPGPAASDPAPSATPPAEPARAPKRKAVDVFMRPKKR